MTPKEKALESCNKYLKFCNELSHDKNKTLSKLMSIACVDEIMEIINGYANDNWELKRFYGDVKQEIEKL